MRITGTTNRTTDFAAVALACLLPVAACGCSRFRADSTRDYSTLPADQLLEFEEASKLNAKGIKAFDRQSLEAAERHFRDSLNANTNFGPAHNNLGHVYLARHQLYLAAWEFELAANLMPGRSEPVINQGLVYEIAERWDRAESYYREAYELDPRNPEAIGCLVRLAVKQNGDPDEIHFLLKELVFYDSRQEWIQWAEQLLATKYRITDGTELHVRNGPSSEVIAYPRELDIQEQANEPVNLDIESLPSPPPKKLLSPSLIQPSSSEMRVQDDE